MAKHTKKSNRKFLVLVLAILLLLSLAVSFLSDKNIAVLNPKGVIANEQYRLIIISTLLMLIVVIPVFVMTFWFSYKYRAGNKKAKYSPDWDHSNLVEFTWWAVPSAIIVVLSVITFKSTYALDPRKPLNSDKKPLTVQVVALDWKWLFIYPEQNIASVNYLQIPRDTPIKFEITADAPMNSFWIPQLGGQIYAMAGMNRQLNLVANEVGTFDGSSANLSGEGFAGMRFKAVASNEVGFQQWVTKTKLSSNKLTLATYKELAGPSKDNPPTFYSSVDENLYDYVVMQYMQPMRGMKHGNSSGYSAESEPQH